MAMNHFKYFVEFNASWQSLHLAFCLQSLRNKCWHFFFFFLYHLESLQKPHCPSLGLGIIKQQSLFNVLDLMVTQQVKS